MSRRSWLGRLFVVVLAVLMLTACSDDGSGSTELKTVQVSISGGETDPSNGRVEVSRNQPIDLVITADEPGAIHIHAAPEEFSRDFAGGDEDTVVKLQFDRPGQIAVELHDPDRVILTFVVR